MFDPSAAIWAMPLIGTAILTLTFGIIAGAEAVHRASHPAGCRHC